MNDTVTKKRKLINKIMTCLGFLLLISCISLGIYDYILEQRAVNVSATIISLEYNNTNAKALVRYKVEEQTYEQKITLPKTSNLSVKDQTKIKYDMNNPNKLIYNNHEILIAIIAIVSILILIINLPKFIINFKNQRRINKLYKNSIYVKANITDVIVDTNGKKNKGALPYKVRGKYLNPADNQEYIFESIDTYVNPSDIIREYNVNTIVVLVDKTNPHNYYVDLDSLTPKINLIDPLSFISKEHKEEKEEVKEEPKEDNSDVKE